MKDNPNILYISSASFTEGPGVIAWSHVSHLREEGYDTDVLTLYRSDEHPDFLFIKKRRYKLLSKIITLFKMLMGKALPGPPHCFFYKDEENPPVPIKSVLRKITKEYDLVIIYFWQRMLSFKTVECIYDKLGSPVVFFVTADYSHMSGGCHFTSDCERYQIGCGCCPAFNSQDENDFTHRNVLYRQKFYEKVKPIFLGWNSYMHSFYKKSYLLKDAILEKSVPGFDSKNFCPIEKSKLREKYNVPTNIKFVLGFGCQQLNNPRKGIDYLITALNIWFKMLDSIDANNILVVAIGENYDCIKSRVPFQSIGLGLMPFDKLSEFYSLLNIFVCPSVDDAGPSMVLQSIACGTPVVGFEMGAMIDHVKDKGTGYCAKLKDADDLAYGISLYYSMTDEKLALESKKCRDLVLNHYKYSNKIREWMSIYRKYASIKYHNEINKDI